MHVTRDGGKNWQNVTPPKDMMPEWIQINSIDASPFDAGTAYVAATMYKCDDYKPYLYKTSDYGKTWKKITNGIPDGAFTRVIREDPERSAACFTPELRPACTFRFDDGDNWQSMQFNLPVVPITDPGDSQTRKGTGGGDARAHFWIFDDLPALHQMSGCGEQPTHICSNPKMLIACRAAASSRRACRPQGRTRLPAR